MSLPGNKKTTGGNFPLGENGQHRAGALDFSASGINLSGAVRRIPCGTRKIGLFWVQSFHSMSY